MKTQTLDRFRTITQKQAQIEGYIALAGPYADRSLNAPQRSKELTWLDKTCNDLAGCDCVFVIDNLNGVHIFRHNSELDIDPETGTKMRHHK